METLEIVISIGVVVALVFVMTVGFIISRKSTNTGWKKKAMLKLDELIVLSNNDEPAFIKTAIMEVDKLLDFILQQYKIPGTTLGERLKVSEKYFQKRDNFEKAWQGHKVRNSLAHDLHYKADNFQLRRAFADIASAVRDLAS